MVENSKKEEKKSRENFDSLGFENDPEIKKSFLEGIYLMKIY